MKRLTAVVVCILMGTPALIMAQGQGDDGQQTPPAGHKGCAHHAGQGCCAKVARADQKPGNDPAAKAEGLKQKTCPVSGKPIAEDSFVEYEGQKVYFCCNKCIDKFKGASEQYLPALYKQIYPQRVQVKCPVMGGPANPNVFAEYQGQRVYFCCPGCTNRFQADPAKYLQKLPQVSTEQVHCPVTGKPIDPKQSIEVSGKTVYVCSKECGRKIQADPKQYEDALRPEAGLLARGATARDDLFLCSVCLPKGRIHKRSEVEMVDYKGFRYAMCGPSCTKAFKADPDKYVKALQNEMIRRAGDEPVYTCSMHPSVLQENAGRCPICAMKLTPAKQDK